MTVELQLAKNLYNEEKKYMSKVENQKTFFFNPVNVTIKIMVMRIVN